MAQSGYTPLLVYGSSTAAAEPTAGNLTSSANGAELALNYADGKLFYKNSGGNVRLLAIGYGASTVTPTAGGIQYGTGTAVAFTAAGTAGYILQSNGASAPSWVAAPSTSPGGSTTQVQYNNAGAFGGSANFVFDGTNVGIGTTSPAQALHVVSTGNQIKYPLRLQNDGTSGITLGVGVQLNVYNGTSVANIGAIIGTGSTWSYGTYSANQVSISTGGSGGIRVATASAPISFHTGNADSDLSTERMRIDSSGNVGIGVTPSAWGSFAKALQIGSRTAVYQDTNDAIFSNNTYGATGGNTYIATAAATQYYQSAGTHVWRSAPSGTAGTTITFTEQMRIDSSGNVGIGVTPPTVSQGRLLSLAYSGSGISVTSGTSLDLTNNAYYNTAWKYGQSGKTARLQLSDDLFIFYSATTGTAGNNITFSERARISAAGGFSVGTTADPGSGAIYATGAITAYYSDARLKDVKGTITNALNKVSSLSGVYYTNNEVAVAHGYTSAETQVGLLAQDVEAVLPEVVKAAPFDLDEKGNSKSGEHYKTIQYERVIPLLVEAIKELRAEVQALRG